jgi:hypothetical protein
VLGLGYLVKDRGSNCVGETFNLLAVEAGWMIPPSRMTDLTGECVRFWLKKAGVRHAMLALVSERQSGNDDKSRAAMYSGRVK